MYTARSYCIKFLFGVIFDPSLAVGGLMGCVGGLSFRIIAPTCYEEHSGSSNTPHRDQTLSALAEPPCHRSIARKFNITAVR